MDSLKGAPSKSIVYPVTDGKPMAETDDHRDEMKDYSIDVLQDHFESDPMVYVSGNNFVYITEGEPGDCVSPDAYVVRGVPKRNRDVYKVWEEGGRTPCFVLEVSSKSTRRVDRGDKMATYRDELAVDEYFLFDPRGEWITEKLRGFRLESGVYLPIVLLDSGRLPSPTLGLELGVAQGHLRYYLPGAPEPLPTRRERAERAEEEAHRLRQELDDLRGGKGSQGS